MTDRHYAKGPVAGGAFLALSVCIGVAVGVVIRQPSIGLIGGLAIGTAISLLIWRRDRRRL